MPFLITDVLASEYGWTKTYILESLYFDDVKALFPFIKKRQVSNYKMQLLIVENPHQKEPQLLWRKLDEQDGTYIEEAVLDKSAFDALKKNIAKGGGLVVK